MDEIWKEIPGWEGFYEASSLGQVRSIRRLSRVNSVMPERKRAMGGVIRKATPYKGGYLSVTLTAEGRRERLPVHRAVLLAFKGEPAEGQVARHLNGNPSDNRPDNLEWGSHLENMADRKAHGRYANGEDHHMAKLSRDQVLHIYSSDEQGYVLAERFGIHQTMISDIRRGRVWIEVTGGVPLPSRRSKTARRTDKMDIQKARIAREMRNNGASLKEIADLFSITESTVSGICRGRTWREQ